MADWFDRYEDMPKTATYNFPNSGDDWTVTDNGPPTVSSLSPSVIETTTSGPSKPSTSPNVVCVFTMDGLSYAEVSQDETIDLITSGHIVWDLKLEVWKASSCDGEKAINATHAWQPVKVDNESLDRALDGHFEQTANGGDTDLVTNKEKDKLAEEIWQTNEYVDIVRSKKYKPKLSFAINKQASLETYSLIVGERMDVIQRVFHEGAQFMLIEASYDMQERERRFRFKRDDYYMDLSHEDCNELFDDFDRLDEYVRESAEDRQKKKLQAERRKQKRAEEAEVNRIVLEAHKEEGGFGAWS